MFWLHEGPVRRVGSSLLNPAFEEVNFHSRQSATCFGRWHFVVRVRGRNAADQFTLFQTARHDGARAFAILDGLFSDIESKFGLARTFIRSVATEAFARNDGANLRAEIDRFSGRSARCRTGQGGRNRQPHAGRQPWLQLAQPGHRFACLIDAAREHHRCRQGAQRRRVQPILAQRAHRELDRPVVALGH